MKTRVKSHKGRRAKGHQTERDVANFFKSSGVPAERNLEYQTGHKGDVYLKDFQEYLIQVKNQIRPPILKALEQAEEDIITMSKDKPELTEIGIPLSICKNPGKSIEDSIVALRLSDFLFIFRKAYNVQEGTKDSE